MRNSARLAGWLAGLSMSAATAVLAAEGTPVCPISPACPAGGACGADSLSSALDSVCTLTADGHCVERCGCCTSETTELFAGVTFDPPSSLTPVWPGLGGRGELAAEAALCLLRDLGVVNAGNGVATDASISLQPLGTAEVKQRVALVDFDPVGRTMQGFHAVSICAPPFGCVDDQVQSFTAVLVHAPASGLHCGDYPFDESYGLTIATSDTEHRLRFKLPAITVPTPYGNVTATPEFHYLTALKAGFPPGVNDLVVDRPSPCSDLGTSISPVVGLVNGAQGTALLCALMPPPFPTGPAGHGFGIVSQLGLGGRGVSPDEPLYSASPRPDLDLLRPRTEDERKAVGNVGGEVEFKYDVAGLIPEKFRSSPFELTANVFVTPRVDTGFASQFQVHFTDALYRTLVFFPDCDGELLGDTRLVMQSGSHVHVSFNIYSGFNLVLKLTGISTPFGDITVTVLEKHPNLPLLPMPIEDTADDEWLPAAEASFQHSPEPAFNGLTTFSAGLGVDPAAFLQQCFQSPPPNGQTPPTASFTPGDRNALTAVLEFPCNICFAAGPLSVGCGPDVEHGAPTTLECAIDENGVCYNPAGLGGCIFRPISPSALPPGVVNTTEVLFPTSQDLLQNWFCDSVEKTGCMDLCTFDPTAAQPLKVVQSARDLDPERCGGPPGGQPCGHAEDCDDGNPCTADLCALEGEFGSCQYTPQDAACDDGLFCNGSDHCALGACSLHSGNPCAAASDCCEEGTDRCVATCLVSLPRCGNGLVQSGEECDGASDAACPGRCQPDCSCLPPGKLTGEPCTTPSQCASGFCASGVCCGSACDGAGERCDLPGQAGTCVTIAAPVPVVSATALLAGLVILLVIAHRAVRRRRG